MADRFDDDAIVEAARHAKDDASKRRHDVMERLRRSYGHSILSSALAARSRSAVQRSNDLLAKAGSTSRDREQK